MITPMELNVQIDKVDTQECIQIVKELEDFLHNKFGAKIRTFVFQDGKGNWFSWYKDKTELEKDSPQTSFGFLP